MINTEDNYKEVIASIDDLASKMEYIATAYFEAHVDFMSKLKKVDLSNPKPIDEKISQYSLKFTGLLEELENETKTLKKDKINFEFRRNLLLDSTPLT